ncbi:hypothetical protein R5R35_000217 [Gryllus longicercus]|uniref:Uncharacterized protein n=1 Tax=Gryllus longicercus TaxID=2509291 RepID=A0AAN9ZI51_9ORTH
MDTDLFTSHPGVVVFVARRGVWGARVGCGGPPPGARPAGAALRMSSVPGRGVAPLGAEAAAARASEGAPRQVSGRWLAPAPDPAAVVAAGSAAVRLVRVCRERSRVRVM